jgi:hypothetical protein
MWRKSVFWLLASAALPRAATPPATPVVVELFTSEGCSSCPPADLVLQRLEAGIGVPGAYVIALGEHVTYWELGWKDRFSADVFTWRQEDYTGQFRSDGAYTPQMIVNGQAEFVGSDEARARREILKAAQAPAAKVDLAIAARDMVSIKATGLPTSAKDSDVVLAVTESRLDTDVQHGENGGRTLRHTGVVRSIATVGRIDSPKDGNYAVQARYHLEPSWNSENLKLIVFLQSRGTKRIWGAGAIALR